MPGGQVPHLTPRTPMGGFRGSLSSLSAPQLGALAIQVAFEWGGSGEFADASQTKV